MSVVAMKEHGISCMPPVGFFTELKFSNRLQNYKNLMVFSHFKTITLLEKCTKPLFLFLLDKPGWQNSPFCAGPFSHIVPLHATTCQ